MKKEKLPNTTRAKLLSEITETKKKTLQSIDVDKEAKNENKQRGIILNEKRTKEDKDYNDFFDDKYDMIYSDFVSKNETLKAKRTAASSSTITKRKNENGNSSFIYNKKICEFIENESQNEITPYNEKPKSPRYKKNKNNNYSVSSRLYNYGFYIKNKIARMRKEEQEKTFQKMIPRTLSQSNLILSKKKDKTYNNTSFSKTKINNEEFSHKPTLNNLSIKIASQLEPSSSRLLRKKSHGRYMSTLSKSVSNMENDFIINDYYKNVQQRLISKKKCIKMNNKSADNSTSSIDISCDSKGVPKRVFDLYENGVKLYKQKEEKYKENILKNSMEYKKYTYHPKSSKNSKMINKYLINGNTMPRNGSFYDKQVRWKENVERKNKRHMSELLQEDAEDCTFEPVINQSKVNKSIANSVKNMYSSSGFEYIFRRRKMLEDKKKRELEIKKMFYQVSPVNNKKKGKSEVNSGNNSLIVSKKSIEEPVCDIGKRKVNQLKAMRDMLNTKQFFYEQSQDKQDSYYMNNNKGNELNFEEMVDVIYSKNHNTKCN